MSIRTLPYFLFLHSIVELFHCSIVQMFSRSFLLQSSLFFCSYYQAENKSFHFDRAPDCDCDHRHSRGNASSRSRQGAGTGARHSMHGKSETMGTRNELLFRRLQRMALHSFRNHRKARYQHGGALKTGKRAFMVRLLQLSGLSDGAECQKQIQMGRQLLHCGMPFPQNSAGCQ